jgi:hypothetical protein
VISVFRTTLAAPLVGLALLVAACSGPAATPTPATGSPTPGATTGPTATATAPGSTSTPLSTATAGATNPPAGDACAGYPTMDPNNLALPSFAPDPQLEAHFPAMIDGQPVTDVTSGSLLEFICLTGSVGLPQLQAVATYNLANLTWGTANATVDGDDVTLVAIRLAGGSGNDLVNSFAQLAAALGGSADVSNVTSGSAGGKSVLVVTNSDGTTSYGYVSGDTLITVDEITQDEADKIFSAIQ